MSPKKPTFSATLYNTYILTRGVFGSDFVDVSVAFVASVANVLLSSVSISLKLTSIHQLMKLNERYSDM